MYVKNAPGLSVRDPDRHDRIPDEGRLVPASMYWKRRLGDGSVVLAEAPAEPAPAAELPTPALPAPLVPRRPPVEPASRTE